MSKKILKIHTASASSAQEMEFVVPVNDLRPEDVPEFTLPQPTVRQIQKFQAVFKVLGKRCRLDFQNLNESDNLKTKKFWDQIHAHFYPEFTITQILDLWTWSPDDPEIPVLSGVGQRKRKFGEGEGDA